MRKAEAREQLPEISLLPTIAHEREQLDMALFGSNWYRENIKVMARAYFYSKEFPNITFTPATTGKSISAVACGFGENGEYDAKRDIFDLRWLQAGWILRTQEGVYANPLDAQGNPITDERILKPFLTADRKVNGIYLLDNDMSFAPYDSFTRGVQDCDTFAQGGLARALVHTHEKEAKNLRTIASPKHYKRGVNVSNFEEVKEPVLRVVLLYSSRGLGRGRLFVYGGWYGLSDGYAVGVRSKVSAEGTAKKSE